MSRVGPPVDAGQDEVGRRAEAAVRGDETSALGGSGAEDVVVSDAAPWWQTTLRALDVVFCALAVAAVVMYVLHTYTDVFSEEKRKNRAAKKN